MFQFLDCDKLNVQPEAPLAVSEGYLVGLESPGSYFRVDLEKLDGEKAGFEVIKRTDFLEVGTVGGEPLARWAERNPLRALRPQDRLVRVNGRMGNATLMAEELRSAMNVSLSVFRVDERDLKILEMKRKVREANKILNKQLPGLSGGIPEPPGSRVSTVHAGNLDKFIKIQPCALLMIYASWCGHCRELAPEFTRAAQLVAEMNLPREVKFIKFDDGEEANRVYRAGSESKFNFTSYPHLHWFDAGEGQPFFGDRGAHEIAAHVRALTTGGDPETEVRKSLLVTRPMLYRGDTPPETVLDLEPETFDDILLEESNNNRIWIVEYYSDKCPFCKSLKPAIVEASERIYTEFGSKVRIAAVNSRAFHDLAERFGVTSYPWIIAIYAGKKIEDMRGLGGADSVVNWAGTMFRKFWKSKPVWSHEPIVAPALGSALVAKEGSNNTASWRELLGHRAWFLLHTMAAKYPEEPSAADKAAMHHVVAGIGQLYPCPICRQHLQAKLANLGPVPTDNRQDLAVWFCRLHNSVNEDLNKPRHRCDPFELDLQYLKSCGECTVSKEVDSHVADEVSAWNYFAYSNIPGGDRRHFEL